MDIPAPDSNPVAPRMATGKRQLMDAALRLLAQQGGNEGLSLRELAREAGLNHNTFYRHFDSLDQLHRELMGEFTATLKHGMRLARANIAVDPSVSKRVVGWLFDFAQGRSDLFQLAWRALHGPRGESRALLEACMAELRDDTMAQLRAMQVLPEGHDEVWLRVLSLHGRAVFGLTLRYLEAPEQRHRLLNEADELLQILILGTLAKQQGLVRS